jgi:hypothetical protein
VVKIRLGRKRERLHGRCNGASIERGPACGVCVALGKNH